ncbi:MAG: sensor histidine kinase, partial [Gemmatimonadales bacterium]
MGIGRSGILLLVLGLAAVVLPVLALWIDQRGEDRLDRQRDTQREMILGALGALNAETGLRGYLLTGDERFAEPYDIGLQQVDEASVELDSLVDDEGVRRDLDAVLAAFDRWRTEFAAEEIQRVREGDLAEARSLAALDEGERLFGEVRTEFDALLARMTAETDEAIEARDRASLLRAVLTGSAALALVGFVVTIIHILTARQRQEAALGRARAELDKEREVSRRRKEALMEASHELRNPLTGMLLSAQILEEEAVETGNEDLVMMAGEVVESARRASDLVNDMLDFTRLETGRLELESELIAPMDLVESAVADVRMSHRDALIEVAAMDEEEVPVLGDFHRLRMVVRNLLENGYRYGSPPMRVRVSNGGGDVEIHVEDSGTGVPAEEQEVVFERYHRGSTAEGRDGAGLGLYMSKGIVEMHRGSIRIGRSALGGAEFVVVLPRGPSLPGPLAGDVER